MNPPKYQLTRRARRRIPSAIRELMPYMQIEGMVSLGGGYPSPDTFAFGEMRMQLTQGGGELVVSRQDMARASQYGPTPGLPRVLEQVRQWHQHKDGVTLPEGGLLILNGSQEGIYILADLFLDEEDEVVLSEPVYPGALVAFLSFTQRFLSIPMDQDGLRVDLLEEILAERVARGEALPKLIYDVPNGHNPAGVSLSGPRRRQLAGLAMRYDIPIVEDDPYQLLRLDDSPAEPTLQSLAPDHVFRLDSFSKILCPGLRLGYVSGPPAVIGSMLLYKQAANLQTGSLAQAVLGGYFDAEGNEGLSRRIASNVAFYRKNRDAMVRAAREHLPAAVRFAVPRAGMFVWFELPDGFDTARMIKSDAAELKVLLVPGSAFSTQGGLKNAMRASYAMVAPPQIEVGIQRFGEMIRREQARIDGGLG